MSIILQLFNTIFELSTAGKILPIFNDGAILNSFHFQSTVHFKSDNCPSSFPANHHQGATKKLRTGMTCIGTRNRHHTLFDRDVVVVVGVIGPGVGVGVVAIFVVVVVVVLFVFVFVAL